MPKFKMTEEFKLNDQLIAMGMPTAFEHGKADFSGIAEEHGKGGDPAVVHKAFVEVDEKGTEAAAATAVVIARKRQRSAAGTDDTLPGRSSVPVRDPAQRHGQHSSRPTVTRKTT